MVQGHEATSRGRAAAHRWMVPTAVTCIAASVALMVALGLEGPQPWLFRLTPLPPWPPWFVQAHVPFPLRSVTLWLTELLSAIGLVLALLAARRGWRPPVRSLILGSVVAVVVLAVMPPVDGDDPVYYASYGRIAELGYNPYVAEPVRQLPAADPIRAAALAPVFQLDPLSLYGPVATATEVAAWRLAGDSVARTLFWLKVWNALAYLGVVLALDRAVRSDPARRVRAHLLWSVNPLMLLAMMAAGHNDVLAAAAGACGLLVMRRAATLRGLLAGVLVGLASAIKSPYALFGAALAWAFRRSPRTLAALVLGAVAVVVPGYLLSSPAAITATMGLASASQPGHLRHYVAALLGGHLTNVLGLLAGAVLAAVLLWRMPRGPRDFPAVRVALALGLGLLVFAPLQVPNFDAMIFPLLAVFPATRLDWFVVARNAALAAEAGPVISRLDPGWLTAIERISTLGTPELALAVVDVSLLWLCWTKAWKPETDRGSPGTKSVPAEFSPVRPSTG
jgi:hypothetical protein